MARVKVKARAPAPKDPRGYTVEEVMAMTGWSRRKVMRQFENQPGAVWVDEPKKRVKFAMTAHIDPNKMHSLSEAAAILALSRQTVIREIKRRHIPVQVVGHSETLTKGPYRTIRIQGAALIEMMNGMEKGL